MAGGIRQIYPPSRSLHLGPSAACRYIYRHVLSVRALVMLTCTPTGNLPVGVTAHEILQAAVSFGTYAILEISPVNSRGC